MMSVNILAKATEDLGGALSSERIALSLRMTVLGMVAIFSVLAIIWLVLSLFKFFFYNDPDKNNSKDIPKSQEASDVPTVEVQQSTSAPSVNSNDETVAAIIAAISAYISDDPELSKEYSAGFRVVSFKRVRPKATWNNKNN